MGKGFGPAQKKIIAYLEKNRFGRVADFFNAFGKDHHKSTIYNSRKLLSPNENNKWAIENVLIPPREKILWDDKQKISKAKVWTLNKKNPKYVKYKE